MPTMNSCLSKHLHENKNYSLKIFILNIKLRYYATFNFLTAIKIFYFEFFH